MDIILQVSIAIVYNLFVHNLASISFKDEQFEEKQHNTTIMLIIFGIFAIVASKLIFEDYFQSQIISTGFFYGGILLIITAIFANWNNITTQFKLIIVGIALGLLIWYSYKKETSSKQTPDITTNEQIINETIKE